MYLWTLQVQWLAENFFLSMSSLMRWRRCNADQEDERRPKMMWGHPIRDWESTRVCSSAE